MNVISARAWPFAVGVMMLATLVGSVPARSDAQPDPVRAWNELALGTARAKSLSDARAARLYAMVNVAMYDAVNGIVTRHGERVGRAHALVPSTGAPPDGDLHAAASAAAHAVLVVEFPDRAALYDTQLASDLAALSPGEPVSHGQAWGAQVGAAVRDARANDGSTPSQTQNCVADFGLSPGVFRTDLMLTGIWSGVQFRNLAPFGIADSSIYVGSGPPALSSLDYAGAFVEAKVIGSAANVDAGKLATFQYWSLGGGTSQPAGAWIQVGLVVTAANPLPLPEMTRLFALLGMTMSDTVAPTVMTKFIHCHWRTATAIREADTDGNPLTDRDPSWCPRSSTTCSNIGTSPEYWSGHSSFSAAGAAALAGFFCDDNIAFSLVTDSAPDGQARAYPSFSSAAAEAGRSRVVGGIHFEFSNQEGLASGRAVAAEILANKLLRRDGPTHLGQCPL